MSIKAYKKPKTDAAKIYICPQCGEKFYLETGAFHGDHEIYCDKCNRNFIVTV